MEKVIQIYKYSLLSITKLVNDTYNIENHTVYSDRKSALCMVFANFTLSYLTYFRENINAISYEMDKV